MVGLTIPGSIKRHHDIKNAKISRGLSHITQSSDMSAQRGFSFQIEDGSGETLIPPGFEGINATEIRSSRKGKILKGHLVNTEKRLTRSQDKKRKKSRNSM